jgi:hypothetical protein
VSYPKVVDFASPDADGEHRCYRADVASRLPVTPDRLLSGGTRSALLQVNVLPDGRIAESRLIATHPNAPTVELETNLIQNLWGAQLPPTDLDKTVTVVLFLERAETAEETAIAVLSSDDCRLLPWFEALNLPIPESGVYY